MVITSEAVEKVVTTTSLCPGAPTRETEASTFLEAQGVQEVEASILARVQEWVEVWALLEMWRVQETGGIDPLMNAGDRGSVDSLQGHR